MLYPNKIKVSMRSLFFILFFALFIQLSADPLKLKVSAKSAILINAKTGAILYEKNAHSRAYPASLTKIATCLYALKKNNKELDELVTCPNHCLRKMNKSVKIAHNYKDPAYILEPDGTHFWIKRGEELPFRDLLYGMMLASGNDAANFIAHYIGGNIFFVGWRFVSLRSYSLVETMVRIKSFFRDSFVISARSKAVVTCWGWWSPWGLEKWVSSHPSSLR